MDLKETAAHTIEVASKYRKRDCRLAAEAIFYDCCDRRGIKHEMGKLEDGVQEDLLEMWTEIISQCTVDLKPEGDKDGNKNSTSKGNTRGHSKSTKG